MIISRNSYWVSSGFYSLLVKVITVLTGFANFYILIRLLSRLDYGAWVLFISVCTVMELVKHGFIRNPLIRYLAISEKKESGVLQTASLLLNFGIGMIQAIVLVVFAYVLSEFWSLPQLRSLFLIYIITTFALIPANHFEIVQQASVQFKEIFYCSLAKNLPLFLFIILALTSGWRITLVSLAWVQCISTLLTGILSFSFSRQLLQFSSRLDRKWLAELFHYGKFTFGTNVSSMIVKNIDSWMLGRMISAEAVTIFNPAIRVSNLVEVPADTLSFIYFPHISKKISEAENQAQAVKYFYEKAVAMVLAAMIPIVFVAIFFAREVVHLIAGRGFEETVPILQVTMLFGLLIPFNRFLGITLDAIGKAALNFKMVLAMAVMNVVSNIFLIYQLGTIGAAYGTLTTYVVMVTINQVFLQRRFGVSVLSIGKLVIKIYKDLFSQFGFRVQSPWKI